MKQLYNNLYHHDTLPFLTLFIATSVSYTHLTLPTIA